MARILPYPLVRFTKHPLRWLFNKLQLLTWAVALAYVGMLIVAGSYYVLFELHPAMTSLWHHTVSDSALRHNLRAVFEGMLGGLLAQQAVWNHYKTRGPKHWFDRLEGRLGIANLKDGRRASVGQVLATPFLVLLYGVPGFVGVLVMATIANAFVGHLHSAVAALQATLQTNLPPQGASLWARAGSLLTFDWQKKLLGYGAAFFFGRRPAKAVFDSMQLWFAERRVTLGRPLHWYHTPTFKARYNDVAQQGVTRRYGFWHTMLIRAGVVASMMLAAIGLYVLLFVAGA